MSVKFYSADNFRDKPKIQHGFYTRLGGHSSGVYDSLNCGIGSEDDAGTVQRNRVIVAHNIGVNNNCVVPLYQIHGAKCHLIEKMPEGRLKGDGLVTRTKGIALSILTADCAPVLFYGEDKKGKPVIGAAHAGSKGALAGVLDQVVHMMVDAGAVHDGIKACVGPCISKLSYEVGVEFINKFMEENEDCDRFFHPGPNEGKAQFDLSGYCAWRLYRAGVKDVSLLDVDTYTNETEFFSYRRSVHQGEEDYGRQISVMALNP